MMEDYAGAKRNNMRFCLELAQNHKISNEKRKFRSRVTLLKRKGRSSRTFVRDLGVFWYILGKNCKMRKVR